MTSDEGVGDRSDNTGESVAGSDERQQQQTGPQAVRDAFDALESDLARLEAAVRESDGASRDGLESDGGQNADVRPTRAEFETVVGRLQDVLAEIDGGHRVINRRSGGTITPLDPDPDAIDLADIAHALSNLSRFTGQGKQFYSVARHAVHVSREVEARGGSLSAQRWGLLHDASEAYLSDVPAPVKRTLPGYTRAEKRLQDAVQDAFALELTAAEAELVDAVDTAVGRYELSVHFPASYDAAVVLEYDHHGVDALSLDTECDAVAARDQYLQQAHELGLDTV
ncbi:HD family hydrolase [Natrialba magadii ATCC 43099]|uniref:HD family hydrolase n=1 Tax=Natrialba magadii (strain ATCC 43099 / DSM 3394 / CCM 3739 / CIP 104546 / IAM 13178 / JCM 8861 / NBRC 102185 / NCIMB 2190 / MS3) TaxID=547559 RepID=D3SUK3_NATMM|nr:hypothetical protein [Natrialba magadii]ADD05261.1 HD family hydrolase [Natrialba magadii ATCC 43099]ELY29017.1 hypothetical protein C500_11930 [Natrialba magadii ATCC 43099]